MMKPITPAEVMDKKLSQIPDCVIEAFNTLIAKRFDGLRAVIKQDDVLAEIVNDEIDKSMVFKNNWLDVATIYRDAGWNVEYDRPGYNETYPASFKFTKRYA